MRLQEYLEKKPLYYEKIDTSRMPRVYEKIKDFLPAPKIVHLVGTNAKGTTGRFLAEALFSMGFAVGHYTSPHIKVFNERIWLNGKNANDTILEQAHLKLQSILEKEDSASLSYFEYTTFLAMLVFYECEYVVMEAGLGGEYDATAVFAKELSIITPIGYDHEVFLGSTIEEIAATKLRAIQKRAVIGVQKYDRIYEVAQRVCTQKSVELQRVEEVLDAQDTKLVENIYTNLSLVPYLKDNLALSIAALKLLELSYGAENFSAPPLFARATKLKENIILDVGHNTLAAQALVDTFALQRFTVVYNSYKDKNYRKILEILKPLAKKVEIIALDDPRAASFEEIAGVLESLEIKYGIFQRVQEQNNYLVFGSFSVVEKFLREYHD